MQYDKEFLRELDKVRTKTKYARITTLTWDELPIQSVEGRVTQGSINLDGASAVRRTCSLTMVVDDVDVSNYYWGLNTKFKLEIGIKNNVDDRYPDTIWFPQGIYLITSLSSSLGTNNFTLQIQGKDKMSLLNGDIGGSITAQTVFDSWEEERNGMWVIEKYPIKQIIRDAVHQYGGEPFHNIIINDLDEMGLELLEYRYDTPMFLIRESNNNDYIQGTLNADTQFKIDVLDADSRPTGEYQVTTIGAKDDNGNYIHSFDILVDTLTDVPDPTIFYADGKSYCIAKIEYGETAGYRATDMIYPSDLIGNVGESLTSVLDKIKNLLGEFEYFYDIDGRFIFQRKHNYLDSVWSPIGEDNYVKDMAHSTAETYTFSGNELISAFNNTPNLNNIRNDFSVWGSRKGVSGADIPIHIRYAIDEKPIYYKSFDGIEYCTNIKYCADHLATAIWVEWQEIIYQMQADYRKYNRSEDFEITIMRNNPPIEELNFEGYTYGRTGYEIYYVDLEGFWRELYYPQYAFDAKMDKYEAKLIAYNEKLATYSTASEEKQALQNEIAAFETEIVNFLQDYSEGFGALGSLSKWQSIEELTDDEEISAKILWSGEESFEPYYNHWHRLVYEEPENLNFWFDFLDLDGVLNNYSRKAIGARPKAVNDKDVTSIYFRSTPTIIFYSHELEKTTHTGYRYFQVADIESMCSVSAQGKCAKEAVDALLYQHSYALENASITAIPIYHLELNSRVNIHDERVGISGEYIVTKISLPLTYNGTMSITATKAIDYII